MRSTRREWEALPAALAVVPAIRRAMGELQMVAQSDLDAR
jgi:hypothetical protein